MARWLIVSEAASKLGVSTQTITRYIRMGTLPAKKRGNQWWINETELLLMKRPKQGRPFKDAATAK